VTLSNDHAITTHRPKAPTRRRQSTPPGRVPLVLWATACAALFSTFAAIELIDHQPLHATWYTICATVYWSESNRARHDHTYSPASCLLRLSAYWIMTTLTWYALRLGHAQ
jgi:hypothetical protein